jgi:DNA repair protein NreA
MAQPPVDPALCVRCKGGRALCGKPCYLMADIQRRIPQVQLRKAEWDGPSPPALFVGRHGYPDVRTGPLVAPGETSADRLQLMGDTRSWFGAGIEDLVAMRSMLVNGHRRVDVHAPRDRDPGRVLQVTQELAMADRATGTELRFDKAPGRALAPRLGDVVPPMGPGVATRKARLTENPHVPRPVDRLVGDTDARAANALVEIVRSGVAPDHATRLLSAGLLGSMGRRKLVPTRWSITATDDTLSKALVERVRELPVLDVVRIYEGEYNGNHFLVMLLPRVWGFEMQETWGAGSAWAPKPVTVMDYEEFAGRKAYASQVTGAYYAARLAVAEHLVHRLRRQATAVVVRQISDLYWAPLGVWLIRETVRHALAGRGLEFPQPAAAIAHMDRRSRVPDWRSHSRFLGQMYQTTLGEFVA